MSVLTELTNIRDQCAHVVELRSRQVRRESTLAQKHASAEIDVEEAQIAFHQAMIALSQAEIALLQEADRKESK